MATATSSGQDNKSSSKHTKFNKQRFDELHNREDLSDVEEEEYTGLRKLRGESAKARKATVLDLVSKMKEHDISMLDLKDNGAPVSDIDKLFDANTIRLAAGASAAPKTTKKSSGAKKTPGTVEPGTLISVKIGTTGRPTLYMKGTKLGTYVQPAIKALAEEHGKKLEQFLLDKYATEEGKTYFGTTEGKAELTAYAEHARTKDAQPKAKAKK